MSKYKIFEIKRGEMKMRVSNLGASIMSLYAPDSKGRYADVVLGYEKPEAYLKCDAHFGGLIGRVCNRIAGAGFSLDGKKYKLAANDGKNTLHGGKFGFDRAVWDVSECSGLGWNGVLAHYLSKDGEEGFPGNLDVSVFYKLTDSNALVIEYMAYTDRPTLCNLTQHTYFNLSGGKAKDILDNEVLINSDFYTAVDKNFIPTGEILKVAGTALDFRMQKTVRSAVESASPLIAAANGGVDHNFVLKNAGKDFVFAAAAIDPITERSMGVYTTSPALQFYTANFLNGQKGKGGAVYNQYAGLCFETQHTPDAIHHPHFAGVELYPEELYSNTSVYSFE